MRCQSSCCLCTGLFSPERSCPITKSLLLTVPSDQKGHIYIDNIYIYIYIYTHTHTHIYIHKDMCKRDLKTLNIDQNNWGANSRRTVSLETDCAEGSLQVQRDTRSTARRKENEKRGCSPCRQTSVRLHLCPLPQGLSFAPLMSHWPATPDTVPE